MFGDKKILGRHQKNTRYCLKIQEDTKAKALVEAEENERKELEAKQRKEAEELVLKEKTCELTCQFCKKQCKTKYILNNHQTQAKYCLKIQESQNSQEIIVSFITCKYCEKKFSTGNFNRHDSTCKKKNQALIDEINRLKMAEKDQKIAMMKKDQEIAMKEKEISLIYKESAERAQATINEIAKQPTYQKNSTKNIQNINVMISNLTPLDLSQSRVDSIIEKKYTTNDFYEGQKGAAKLIHKHLLTDENGDSQILCTDTERGIFHHMNVNGEHVVDYKNNHLINSVHEPIKRKTGEIAASELAKNPEMINVITKNAKYINELNSKPGLFNRQMAQLTGKNCARKIKDIANTEISLDEIITKEWLLENSKFLKIEHILEGPVGYANYALVHPLNDRLLIDDDYYELAVKPTFLKYLDSKGDIITDHGGVALLKMFFESISEQNRILVEEHIDILSEIIDDEEILYYKSGSADNKIFEKEFMYLIMNNL